MSSQALMGGSQSYGDDVSTADASRRVADLYQPVSINSRRPCPFVATVVLNLPISGPLSTAPLPPPTSRRGADPASARAHPTFDYSTSM
jgi:hypothetical protein